MHSDAHPYALFFKCFQKWYVEHYGGVSVTFKWSLCWADSQKWAVPFFVKKSKSYIKYLMSFPVFRHAHFHHPIHPVTVVPLLQILQEQGSRMWNNCVLYPPVLQLPGKTRTISHRERIVKRHDNLFGMDVLFCFGLIDTCLCLHSYTGLLFLDIGGSIWFALFER